VPAKPASQLDVLKSLAANLQIVKTKPQMLLFLLNYMGKFKIKNLDGDLIIHSHLPQLNSKAYGRFINEQLLAKIPGPAHAQIGLTNACPQNCEYCYNKHRQGERMDTETIIKLIGDLKRMGVLWLGFTGGEPLLNKDICRIIESVGDDCTRKLFTTGCTLTAQKAQDLKNAGLDYVSVSLDHWLPEVHDRGRRFPGAFKAALDAIELFKNVRGLHVSVSSVISKEMLQKGQVEEFLQFLAGLDVHEAWLSETKPSVAAFWDDALLFTEQERLNLVALQDRYNKEGKMTINYLGHFEGREHFGCNAGKKMIYVDAFGEVSPCVFTPMTFGNVREKSVATIYNEMQSHFPSEDSCFINKNYKLFQQYITGNAPVSPQDSVKLVEQVKFGDLSKFYRCYYH